MARKFEITEQQIATLAGVWVRNSVFGTTLNTSPYALGVTDGRSVNGFTRNMVERNWLEEATDEGSKVLRATSRAFKTKALTRPVLPFETSNQFGERYEMGIRIFSTKHAGAFHFSPWEIMYVFENLGGYVFTAIENSYTARNVGTIDGNNPEARTKLVEWAKAGHRVYATDPEYRAAWAAHTRQIRIRDARRSLIQTGLASLGLVPTPEDALQMFAELNLTSRPGLIDRLEANEWDEFLTMRVDNLRAEIARNQRRLDALTGMVNAVEQAGGWEKVLASYNQFVSESVDKQEAAKVAGPLSGVAA
jgi:hypothetical protein